MRIGSRLAIIIFILVALSHLLRLIFGTDIIIGSWDMPLWMSVPGVIVPGLIAWLLWKAK